MGQNCCSRPRDISHPTQCLYCIPEDGTEIVEYNLETEVTRVLKLSDTQVPAQAKYCLLNNLKLLITGGRSRVSRKAKATSMNEPISSVYLFDPRDPGNIKPRSGMRAGRIGHVLIAHENYAYALTGCLMGYKATKTCEKYNVQSDLWEQISPMLVPRIHAAVCLCRNKLYVTGGNTGTSLECVHTIETYDIPLNTWAVLEMRLPIGVWRHACAPYQNGIVVFGGSTPDGQHNFDCFVIGLTSKRIMQMPWLPHAGEFTSTLSVFNQGIYTIESFTGTMLCMLQDGKWTTKCLIQI